MGKIEPQKTRLKRPGAKKTTPDEALPSIGGCGLNNK